MAPLPPEARLPWASTAHGMGAIPHQRRLPSMEPRVASHKHFIRDRRTSCEPSQEEKQKRRASGALSVTGQKSMPFFHAMLQEQDDPMKKQRAGAALLPIRRRGSCAWWSSRRRQSVRTLPLAWSISARVPLRLIRRRSQDISRCQSRR